MNISTGVIWCYVCDTEVIERERAPNEYKVRKTSKFFFQPKNLVDDLF